MKNCFLFILLASAVAANAQSPWTIYNEDNSDLPTNQVNKIVIDAANNKWIGTENGLVVIDAAENWTIYNTDNSGIPGNEIRSIYVENDGSFWVGTFFNGLGHYNGTDWEIFTPANSPLPDYQVKAINKDANDTMWIGTPSGLIKWDGADYWFIYTTANSLLHSPHINDIYIDANNDVFIGTLNGGLSTYIDGFVDYYRTDNSLISDNTVLSIDEDIYHNKWMATSFGGLSVFTPDETFLKFTPLTSDISDWSVDAVCIDADNIGLMAMSSTGLNIFNNIDWTHYITSNSSMPDDYVNAVATDAANRIWMGTDTGGVVILDRALIENTIENNPVSLNLYPNPATNNCIVTTNFNEGAIEIYSLSGNLCLSQKIKSNTLFINVSDLQSGNYLVKMICSEGVTSSMLNIVH